MLDFIKETQDVWESLQNTTKPIVLYGMGNGADQIIDWCEAHHVEVAGIFASDEFVRGQIFRGHKVETYTAVKARLTDFLLVIAFASESPLVLAHFRKLDEMHETVAPHLPLFNGDEIVTLEWLEQNAENLQQVYDRLADEESRRVLAGTLNYKLSGKLRYLWEIESDRKEDLQQLFCWEQQETYVDLGAYNGDTITEFLELVDGKYKEIIAVEPDRKNYQKLSAYIEEKGLSHVNGVERAVWSEETEMTFSDSGGRQASLLTGNKRTVQTIDVDTLLGNKCASYIKMDVEGTELEALRGGAGQISQNTPKLFVAAYHHDRDLFVLPLFLWQLVPDYKIYLRKHPYIPAWELNFLATKQEGLQKSIRDKKEVL